MQRTVSTRRSTESKTGSKLADVFTTRNRLRWLGWGLLVTSTIVVSLHRLSTAVLSDSLVRTFNLTGSELGIVHAGFFYTYAAGQVPSGLLADRWGVRNAAVAGTVVLGVAAVAFSFSHSYLTVVIARVLMGLGGGVLYVATLRYAANWFRPDEFATVTGLTVGAFGFGGVLAATPLALLVDAVGWRVATLGLGIGGLVLAIGVWGLVRDTPAAVGFEPVSGNPVGSQSSLRELLSGIRDIFRHRETWALGIVMFAVGGTNLTLLGLWGVPYLVQLYGLSVARASVYTLLGSVGWTLGPVIGGRLAARTGRRFEFILGSAAVYAASFSVLAITGTPPLPVVAAVFFASGFLIGGFSLSFTIIKEQSDSSLSGTATGIMNTFTIAGGALLPGVMGYILDAYWTGNVVDGTRVYTLRGYRLAFALATLMGTIALICGIWLHTRGYDASQ
jgi:MFS family permease